MKTKKAINDDWFLSMLSDGAEFAKSLAIHDTVEMPEPEKVIYNDPATIVYWADGSEKTVVRCQPGDTFDKEKGLLLCIAKKAYGGKSAFNRILKEWKEDDVPSIPVSLEDAVKGESNV